MSETFYIGYDPGVSPNLSLVGEKSGWVAFADYHQTGFKVTSTKWEPSGPLVRAAIVEWELTHKIGGVFAEKIGAWTGQGLVSSSNFVGASKLVEGVCIGLGYTVVTMTPPVWKRQMKLLKTDGDASRGLAAARWPDMAQHLKLKQNHNRAEAALIAQAGIEIQRLKGAME